MTPEDFNAATAQQIQQIGALHYFGEPAQTTAESLGLDGFRFYFVGRAGVLGDAPADVARSSFGYFEPGVMTKMWNTGKERADITEVAQAQLDIAYRLGADKLGQVDGLGDAAIAMREMADAIDPAGLPLFAGFRTLEMPEDPTHAFMHQAIVHRELRGSVHLACCAAMGLRSSAAHRISRPQDLQMFGYREEIAVSDDERSLFEQLEPMTDAAMTRHAQSINAEQRSQVAATVHAAHAALGLSG